MVGESISYFSMAVIDTVAKSNLWKKEFKFGLMVKEGWELVMMRRHGRKWQAQWQKQEAKRSYLQPQTQSRESELEMGWGHGLPVYSQWQPSSSKFAPPTASPSRSTNQGLNNQTCEPMGKFLTQTTTVTNTNIWTRTAISHSLYGICCSAMRLGWTELFTFQPSHPRM